jgi:hypothetical protein
MKKFIFFLLSLVIGLYGWTQGCVAIRNVTGLSPDLLFENIKPDDKLIVSLTGRYFEAPKAYRDKNFFADTLVRNKLFTLNFSALRLLKNGWSLGVSIPVAANSRKNFSDHGGLSMPKQTTRAFGLGDIRLNVNKWIIDPAAGKKGNAQISLGLKLPTGDFRYQDYFYRKLDSAVLAPVDQAIQLGDGGLGITTELNAFYSVTTRINIFLSSFYLINPRDQNGVSNLKGRSPSPAQIANNTTVMSVPDQFNFRSGINYDFRKIVLSAGFRYEKIPAKDLIGGNRGFRRVASISSAEGGLIYKMKNSLLFANLGIPFQRKIKQNKQNDFTPAGFANYIFIAGTQLKL